MSTTRSINFRLNFQNKSVQSEKKCSLFNPQTSQWLQDVCETRNIEYAIECKCSHQSTYGIVKLNDPSYYGFNNNAIYVIVGINIFSLFLAALTYFFFFTYLYTYFSLCLMQLMIATCMTQVFYLIIIIMSPGILASVQEPYSSNIACSCFGAFFHYFILAQFTWMFITSLNYYIVLSRRTNLSPVYKFVTFLIGWVGPVIIIGAFYLITSLIYELKSKYSASFIYTDVLDNFDVCFIKNLYAYLGGLILPSLVLILITTVFTCLIAKSHKEWGLFDDIYLDRFNRTEIIYVLVFYCLVLWLNVMGGIQIRYGSFWLFIVVCFIEMFIALYVFVVFTMLRHTSRVFYSRNNNLFVNYYNKKLAFNLNLIVKRVPSLPKNYNARREISDMKNLLRYVENKEKRALVKNVSSDDSVRSKRVKQIVKPSISWINTLAEPNTAYTYYYDKDKLNQTLANRMQRVDSLTPNAINDNNRLKSGGGGIHNEKKISFSSNVTNLDLFDITNC
jgi:hypothetical protein